MTPSSRPAARPLEEGAFRRVMASFPAGVTIVSTYADGGEEEPRGMTASSFLSVSLHPMLILVSVAEGAQMHGLLERSGRYAVNLLDSSHRALARRFAGSAVPGPGAGVVPCWRAVAGAPVLEDAAAYVVAEVREEHRSGDHTLFVGAVRALGGEEGRASAGDPLAYLRGRFGRVVPHDDGWASDLDPWGGAHGRAWG